MNPLPDIHPGTPGTMRVKLELVILHTTAKAFLVDSEAAPGVTFWLPRSLVGLPSSSGRRADRKIAGTDRIHFEVGVFYVPVWFYRKLRKELEPCPPLQKTSAA